MGHHADRRAETFRRMPSEETHKVGPCPRILVDPDRDFDRWRLRRISQASPAAVDLSILNALGDPFAESLPGSTSSLETT